MKTKLLVKISLSFLFVCGGIFSSQAQSSGKVVTTSKTTDVTTAIHEPGITIHEPGVEIHEPGVEIHEPGIEIHEPGFQIHEPGQQNQGPGHNSSDKIRMQLYPNPAVDMINVHSEHYHFRAYSIYDNTDGRVLDKGVFDTPDHTAQIQVSQLAKGLYILVVEADQRQIAVKRFSKK